MLYLPEDVIINCVLSHLYPSDLEKCKEADTDFKHIIEKNEEYILRVCQHIQPHGECKELYENGQLWWQSNYKDGKADGEYKKWYESGQLECQEYYKDGKLHGELKRWYNNGQLFIQIYYKDGEKHGEYKQWYDNGQLRCKINYKDGKLEQSNKN